MVNYAVLGLGLMGKALCNDLLIHDSTSNVIGLDLNLTRRKELEREFQTFGNRFQTQDINLKINGKVDNDPMLNLFQQYQIDVAFGAIDYKFNVYLTKLCIKAGVHFLDLGGNPDVVNTQKSLNKKAEEAGITVIPDCGLAPGMANILAAHGMRQFDSLESCHIRVGGLPQKPIGILKYSQFFNIRGLTNEYLEDAIVIRNRTIEKVSSLTELETLEFPDPWGKLEAFQTAGGTSSLPELFEGKIKDLTYKTIRYLGHCQFFQFLKEVGLLSSEPYPNNTNINPREIIEFYLKRSLPQNAPDVVLIRILITGIKDNKNQQLIFQIIDLADENTGYSAMARTTSYPISIIGQMIAKEIINDRGVIPGEMAVPAKEFMKELDKRSINLLINNVDLS
ncbi:MAG: saccharopine dehydrogenase family protein [Candidatus Hodarchaeales archaeon]|jgi:lysine 6-dehydrogenase